MHAIIETGGKQYRVAPGDVIRVEKLSGEVLVLSVALAYRPPSSPVAHPFQR